jgi:ABC-type Na+ efflux pump permease subunit
MTHLKKIIPASLALLVISLFLPWHLIKEGSISMTVGAFVGDVKDAAAYLIMLTPAIVMALLATILYRKRFARWLGIVVAVFSAISIFLLVVSFSGDKFGSLSLHIGGYLGILGVVCAFGAGILYSVKPEPKRAMR